MSLQHITPNLNLKYCLTWENVHGPEGRGESLSLAWSQEHQNFEHEDWKGKTCLITLVTQDPQLISDNIYLSWVSDQPKGRWRPVVRTSGVLPKKLPFSISGSKWSLGRLDSQGLSCFTDNFCTCFPQSVAPWKERAANLMFSLRRGHFGLRDICQDSLQMTLVVWFHNVTGYRLPHWWETYKSNRVMLEQRINSRYIMCIHWMQSIIFAA